MVHKKWPWSVSLAYSKPHLYTYFDICLADLCTVCFRVRFNDQRFVCVYFLSSVMLHAPPIIHLHVIILIMYGEDYKLWSFPSCLVHHCSVTLYLIVCSVMCPETSSCYVFFSCERRGKIVLYDGKWKKWEFGGDRHFLKFNQLLIVTQNIIFISYRHSKIFELCYIFEGHL